MNMRTIGCVELNSIAMGLLAADAMIKTAAVELVMARPTCPGRYLAVVTGETSAVESAVQAALAHGNDALVDWFVIPAVHGDVIPALCGATPLADVDALGVIETCSTASCILAADAAAKAADVALLEIRFAAGLAGKGFVLLTGDVASVRAAVDAGVAGVKESGPVLNHVVIPSPGADLKKFLA